MEREYCQRVFGNSLITIDYSGHICIADDWATNWGLIYGNNINRFKTRECQVIGMDLQPAQSHIEWIYSKVRKGYFDHLIE